MKTFFAKQYDTNQKTKTKEKLSFLDSPNEDIFWLLIQSNMTQTKKQKQKKNSHL
jgi:succinate dehydrogenase flavin-adding protein (antitoxin of CptAB toxin-antitoxin module)